MKGRRWELTPKGVKIGRAESCEVLVADVVAELFHCIVKLVDGKPVVLNLASDHGVVVNGSNVDEAQLKPNDEISVGGECFAIAAIGGEKRGGGAQIAAPVVALVLALAAVAFVLWRKGQTKPPAAPTPVATNAVAQVAEAAVTTNRVVHVVTEERVVTNRIVRIVDNVMVTNYVVEVRRVDEKTGAVIVESDNAYVPPEPTDGLVLSEDGKTLEFVPQGIAHVVIPNGVTTIADRAFANHKALETVTIPPSVTKFGRDAFRGCDRLTGVFITDLAAWCQISFEFDNKHWNWEISNPLWYAHNLYLNGLLVRDAVIPKEVSSIGNHAFRGCSSLTSVTIPKSVTHVGPGAFASCGNLVRFVVAEDSRHYKSVNGLLLTKDGRTLVAVPGGNGEAKIPEGTFEIGDRAFAGCFKLTHLSIPDGVTSIGYKAFTDCSGLTSIAFPPSMAKIAHGAFSGCNGLVDVYITDLAAWCRMAVDENGSPLDHDGKLYHNGALVVDMKIPDGVTRIGSHVFRGCSSLTSVTIPRTVESIGGGSFAKCDNLVEIRVANGNRHYKDDDGVLLTRDGRTLVAVPGRMENVKIPNGVEVIGSLAFTRCKSITRVKIPYGVSRIGYSAFSGCKELAEVEIPNSVNSFTSVGTFWGCKSLTSVTIPGSLANVAESAFNDSGLTNVVIQQGVRNIGRNAFRHTRLSNVMIPDSVTNIAEGAFAYCKQLESIAIPERLTNIHERAFEGCTRLLDANGKPLLTRVPSTAEKTKSSRSAK